MWVVASIIVATCINYSYIYSVDIIYLCVAVKQLGLHWSLKKQRCDTTAMTEYVSILPAETFNMTNTFLKNFLLGSY